jgi:hypothetical protein
MAVRKNPDGSITVGILNEETPVAQGTKVEDSTKPKPKRAKKTSGES